MACNCFPTKSWVFQPSCDDWQDLSLSLLNWYDSGDDDNDGNDGQVAFIGLPWGMSHVSCHLIFITGCVTSFLVDIVAHGALSPQWAGYRSLCLIPLTARPYSSLGNNVVTFLGVCPWQSIMKSLTGLTFCLWGLSWPGYTAFPLMLVSLHLEHVAGSVTAALLTCLLWYHHQSFVYSMSAQYAAGETHPRNVYVNVYYVF